MNMSSPSRRSLLRHPEVVDTDCSLRRSKLADIFSCSSLKKQSPPKTLISYANSVATTWTTHQTSSFNDSPSPSTSISPSPVNLLRNSVRERKREIRKGRNEVEKMGGVGESMEVVMESRNPYLDFRDSITMMIVEKEIYAWDDLRELLQRLLSLNSPHHHHHILRAFAETLNVLFTPDRRLR